jgi:hypothetical protein
MILIDFRSLKGDLYIEKGIISGCPFCKGINTNLPKIGDKIRVLSDFLAGKVGEVVEVRQEEIVANFINGTREDQYRILLKYDLIESESFAKVPNWAPSIPLRYAAELHNYVINFCKKSFHNNSWKFEQSEFILLVVYIWFKRLPIEPLELWELLQVHGIPLKMNSRILKLYDIVKETLKIYHFMNSGRNYKTKRRTSPFSV